MVIRVSVVGSGYVASVTPYPGGGERWESGAPMTGRSLVEELLKLGCHQTDIGDAFYQADQEWVQHLDRSVLP